MMRQTQQVGHKVNAHVLLFVLSVLLISTTVIVSVLSYSSITRLQDEQTALQQKHEALYSQYASLLSNYSALGVNFTNLLSLYANLQSQYLNLESDHRSLQIEYASLQSQYASLMENYSNLLIDYQQAVNDYLAKMPLVTDSSYYIFKQNDTYYAKSGLTGEIEYHDENCSLVINYVLTHVPYGGAVFFKPLASADDAYYIDTTIYPPSGTTLASENKMVTLSLKDNCNVDIIQLYDVFDTQIRNLRIDGNKEHNKIGGNGIDINSNFNLSYDSKHTIEDVEIWNCSTNGILNQQRPRDNTFMNVKVYYCNQYNVEIDSSDQTLINVQSGWAGHSGFEVLGMDNYFTNCVSWGCGSAGDKSDANGFLIKGVRNLFIGCDAGANDGGGFVLDHAEECMLTSCIGRDNGRRIKGTWGFDLYNTKSTTLSGCLSTDENDQINKTQYYGFTEGGFSDYNLVTGCNFEGNRVGAVFALTGAHTVVRDTLGYSLVYETGSFIYPNASIVVGTNDTYGDVANFTLPNGTTTDFHVTIFVDSINETANETVTVKVQVITSAGNVTSLEIPRNTNGTCCLTPDEVYGLLSNGNVDEVLISARTTENATTATVTVNMWGRIG